MKYGGITWWRGNYGSILQAYALAKAMNSIPSVEYEVIDQYGDINTKKGLLSRAKGKSFSHIASKLVFRYLDKNQRKRTKALNGFIELNIPVSSRSYSASEIRIANSEYDGFICGSDQIWNLAINVPDPMYWLSFVEEGKKKIAYAPSLGVKSFTASQKDFVVSMLKGFDAISCREQSGTELINSILGNVCTTVSDPTFLIEPEEWARIGEDNSVSTCLPSKPYVFAYLLIGNKQQKQLIERFAKDHGLTLICFPELEPEHIDSYDKKFGDEQVFDANPADFIRLIRGAEYVFTDSFHCSVFSSMFHRNFYIFEKLQIAQSERLDHLMTELGTGNRRISPDNAEERIQKMKVPEWDAVDQRLQMLRGTSFSYLKKALTGIEK